MNSLTYLMAAYFHEDWNHTHTTWQAVIDEFLKDNPVRVAAAPREIDEVLSRSVDDEALAGELIEMGCAFNPPGGPRAWLDAVAERIRAGSSQR